MFLKRGLAAALAAVTVIGLAGCGGSDDAAEADTATVKKGFVEKKVEPVNFDSGVELTSDCYHFIYALGNAPATIDAAHLAVIFTPTTCLVLNVNCWRAVSLVTMTSFWQQTQR